MWISPKLIEKSCQHEKIEYYANLPTCNHFNELFFPSQRQQLALSENLLYSCPSCSDRLLKRGSVQKKLTTRDQVRSWTCSSNAQFVVAVYSTGGPLFSRLGETVQYRVACGILSKVEGSNTANQRRTESNSRTEYKRTLWEFGGKMYFIKTGEWSSSTRYSSASSRSYATDILRRTSSDHQLAWWVVGQRGVICGRLCRSDTSGERSTSLVYPLRPFWLWQNHCSIYNLKTNNLPL